MRRPLLPPRTGGPALVLALLAALLAVTPAGAGVSWCRADPIVRLDGTEVQILVAVPEQYVALVNGPIDVEVYTPRWVTQELVMTDAGFNGYGETVQFGSYSFGYRAAWNGQFRTWVRVRVPMDTGSLAAGTTVPLELTVSYDGVTIVRYGWQNPFDPGQMMTIDFYVPSSF
jgi:hypothetical protein